MINFITHDKEKVSKLGNGIYFDIDNNYVNFYGDINSNKSHNSNKYNNSFDIIDDSDKNFKYFDWNIGNSGIFKPKVSPENISIEDVKNAYTIKGIYEFKFNNDPSISREQNSYICNINNTLVLTGPVNINDESEIQLWESLYGPLETTKHLWTANEIGLIEGQTDTIALNNANKLQTAATNDSCIGFYLDKMYYAKPNVSSTTSGIASLSSLPVNDPEGYKRYLIKPIDSSINNDDSINILKKPCKDFIISGAAASEGKGGLHCKYSLFYTDASLILHNVRFEKEGKEYHMIYINMENGIDQIQIINCEFDGANNYDKFKVGRYIHIYSPNTRPYKLFYDETNKAYHQLYHKTYINQREIQKYNYINHLYVYNSSFVGGDAIGMGMSRVIKSWRIINNIFTDVYGVAISFSCANYDKDATSWFQKALCYDQYKEGDDVNNDKFWLLPYESRIKEAKFVSQYHMSTTKMTMSCPMYIVGNTFKGSQVQITKNNKTYNVPRILQTNGSGDYLCSVIAEGECIYFLHNTVEDFLSRETYKESLQKETYVKTDENGELVNITDENEISTYYNDININSNTYLHHIVKNSKNEISSIYRYVPTITRYHAETYDAYLSCCKVFYANNNVKNIIKFEQADNSIAGSGICKAKNTNAGYMRGGIYSRDFIRYYKNNNYTLNTQIIKDAWEYALNNDIHINTTISDSVTINGIKQTETYTYNADDRQDWIYSKLLNDKEIDDNTIFTENKYVLNGNIPFDGKVLRISLTESVITKREGLFDFYPVPQYKDDSGNLKRYQVLKEYVFSNNLVDAENGHIIGFGYNGEWPTNSLIFSDNIFKGTRFSNDKWDERNIWKKLYNSSSSTNNPESYIMNIRLHSIPKYGKSIVKICNNTFIDNSTSINSDNGTTIRLVAIRNLTSEVASENTNCVSPAKGDISLIENNKYIGENTMNVEISNIPFTWNVSNHAPNWHAIETLKTFHDESNLSLERMLINMNNKLASLNISGFSKINNFSELRSKLDYQSPEYIDGATATPVI